MISVRTAGVDHWQGVDGARLQILVLGNGERFDDEAVRVVVAPCGVVNSIDYLLKPINRERLAEAIEKFERLTARYSQPNCSSLAVNV